MSLFLQTPWEYLVDQNLREKKGHHTLALHNLQEIECYPRSYTLKKKEKERKTVIEKQKLGSPLH